VGWRIRRVLFVHSFVISGACDKRMSGSFSCSCGNLSVYVNERSPADAASQSFRRELKSFGIPSFVSGKESIAGISVAIEELAETTVHGFWNVYRCCHCDIVLAARHVSDPSVVYVRDDLTPPAQSQLSPAFHIAVPADSPSMTSQSPSMAFDETSESLRGLQTKYELWYSTAKRNVEAQIAAYAEKLRRELKEEQDRVLRDRNALFSAVRRRARMPAFYRSCSAMPSVPPSSPLPAQRSWSEGQPVPPVGPVEPLKAAPAPTEFPPPPPPPPPPSEAAPRAAEPMGPMAATMPEARVVARQKRATTVAAPNRESLERLALPRLGLHGFLTEGAGEEAAEESEAEAEGLQGPLESEPQTDSSSTHEALAMEGSDDGFVDVEEAQPAPSLPIALSSEAMLLLQRRRKVSTSETPV